MRLIKQHIRFRFVSEAVGRHHAKRPLGSNLRRQFNRGRAHVVIIRKYPEVIFSSPFRHIIKNDITNISMSSGSLLQAFKKFILRLVWLNSIFADILDSILKLFLNLSSLFKIYKLYKFLLIKLYNYKYLIGVKAELNSLAAAKQLAEEALNIPIHFDEIDIDLKTEFNRLEEILNKQPVDGARLAYGNLKIGQIKPIVGVEPLRPPHVYEAIYKSVINPRFNTFNNKELISLIIPFLNKLPNTFLFNQGLTTDQGWHIAENWEGIKTQWMMDKAILPIYSNEVCIKKINFRGCESL